MAMSCLYCGSRLISKTSSGLACCGCGRPLTETRPAVALSWSARKAVLFTLVTVVMLPLVGAIASNDQLRSGRAAPEAVQEGHGAEAE